MNNNETYICQCKCGLSKFSVSQIPRARFKCHCDTCQEVYERPYADVVGVNSTVVELLEDEHIVYKKFSPALERGVCSGCNRPVISFLTMSAFFKLKIALFPVVSLNKSVTPPEAQAHIYYHSCSEPVDDAIPKISGKFSSTLKAIPILYRALFAK